MQTLPEFFQGLIAQDFQGILDADRSPEAASGELAGKAKKPPKTPGVGCSVNKVACKKKSTTRAPLCKQHSPGVGCSPPDRPKKKKAAAFLPDVQGWSIPPAPPAF